MAIFTCRECGWSYKHAVSIAYEYKLLKRSDHCIKCNRVTQFIFTTYTGAVGVDRKKPADQHTPSIAARWWTKKREGKEANMPLDKVCKRNEW